jgi:hypothetical protein
MSWRSGNEGLTGKLSRKNLPQLDESKIRLIKDFEWWDGPLAGLLEYEGSEQLTQNLEKLIQS